MVSSVSSASNTTYLTPLPSSTSAAGASTAFADALTDATAQGTLVSISDEAKAAAASSTASAPVTAQSKAAGASLVASFDINKTDVGMSKADYNAYYAAGAAAVSASQGLPAGQYDFTKLSPKEAAIVSADAMQNHGATLEQTRGLREYAILGTNYSGPGTPVTSNTSGDALTDMVNWSKTSSSLDGVHNAPIDALNWMLTLQGPSISANLQQAIDSAIAAR